MRNVLSFAITAALLLSICQPVSAAPIQCLSISHLAEAPKLKKFHLYMYSLYFTNEETGDLNNAFGYSLATDPEAALQCARQDAYALYPSDKGWKEVEHIKGQININGPVPDNMLRLALRH
jgi:hypothetical protein